eukprot:g11039.t1
MERRARRDQGSEGVHGVALTIKKEVWGGVEEEDKAVECICPRLIDTEEVHQQGKDATIKALFNNGDTLECCNYRGTLPVAHLIKHEINNIQGPAAR